MNIQYIQYSLPPFHTLAHTCHIVDYWAFGVFLFEMTSGKEPFRSKNPMEVYKQIVSGHVDIPAYFSSNLSDLIRKLLNISKSKRLGRTMGGGGAVMQHRWYNGFDWVSSYYCNVHTISCDE